ncbi:NUDIX domain-containing protein [Paenisporosarcina cavernae]|uniref:NUDIX hydrolase n=1 Tax=Paenisporosarcina cavernae TaxID=2320858 RepID=A0A385YRH6_9BACL|nr:NUDIX hydrolase [Paenisporosarcina cavernae]AYC29339.1 NUDIX hydrolase [Paenisporosarcina cavernae]
MSKFEEKTLQSTEIFKGNVISLQVDEVQLPNGRTSNREIVKHPGAVAVIAITDTKKVVMVEQYRKALERTIVEIPAGKLEAGELPEMTAKRELEEETGYLANKWTYLQSFSTSPGFADEIIHLFVAEELTRSHSNLAMDEDEFIDVHEYSVVEMEDAVLSERIFDAKTAYAVIWAKMNVK